MYRKAQKHVFSFTNKHKMNFHDVVTPIKEQTTARIPEGSLPFTPLPYARSGNCCLTYDHDLLFGPVLSPWLDPSVIAESSGL